ncbi:hypothetical protein GCM10009557_51650 [Virgisporangium ochraceum]|uniref:Spheroidene monooxygenase n=1 Tax=Virgisporangium ochraceum TaxID=65505 RepID=A0A8J3ZT99_9ACTN|nr:monooxygenase [Virgisporangium ochraceum]GIJ68658.1 hypothetical protein Voc01_035750 [Virgisporangium ochraceum]
MTVTLDVWRVPGTAVPGALARMAWLPRALRRNRDVEFVKLLGTARGFGVTAADPYRWAALTVWRAHARPITTFDRIAAAHVRLTLRPTATRGRWAGRRPFTASATATDGPVLIITRARLRPARAVTFWRAIGPVAATLNDAEGLLTAFGIGEAPIGFQGTVSIWADGRHVNAFAYRTAEHAEVVRRTPAHRWYAEELFARFEVLEVTGEREVIGWSTKQA